jgi:hypothetical protein
MTMIIREYVFSLVFGALVAACDGSGDGNVDGYGTFIINGGDNYIRYVEEKDGHVLIFWITVSSWKGNSDTPYGVYTKKVRINWPPG